MTQVLDRERSLGYNLQEDERCKLVSERHWTKQEEEDGKDEMVGAHESFYDDFEQ